ARVLASCGVPGGRGPKSICFRTWSIARSPLKAATTGGVTIGWRGLVETFARGRDGGSFFGQAAKSNGISNTAAGKATRLTYSLFIFPLRLACARRGVDS